MVSKESLLVTTVMMLLVPGLCAWLGVQVMTPFVPVSYTHLDVYKRQL